MSPEGGFTLIEIMIVVVIVGLLAAIAVQTFIQIKGAARATLIVNDMRLLRDTFNLYMLEHGEWPEESLYPLDAQLSYGQWGWDGDQGQLVLQINREDPDVMLKVDRQLDDGDLQDGLFQGGGVDFTFTVE